MGKQPVTRGQFDDAAAAKQSAHTTRSLPGFVQLLARKTSGLADGAGNAIEQGFPWKTPKISLGEAPT